MTPETGGLVLSNEKYQLDVSSFLTQGRSSPTECNEQIPGQCTFCVARADQKFIPTRHLSLRRRDMFSQTPDNSAVTQTTGKTRYPTFTYTRSTEGPLRSMITRKWGVWRIMRKRGMIAYKRLRNWWKKRDKFWRRRGNSAKSRPKFILY